jgi:ABC-type branched-subunit amino acid transport system substrate-binding protein
VINNDYGRGFEQKIHQSLQALGGTIINEVKPTRAMTQSHHTENRSRRSL